MSKLVSIITPAYNAAQYIAITIESVRAQTHQNWELIIVDDGSTDDTQAIVLEYCKIDFRIKYTYQPNGKQGKARNNGLKQARGEYIAFLDSDDIWLSEKLTIQLEQLNRQDADLVFSDCYIFSDEFSESSLNLLDVPRLNVVAGTYYGESGLIDFLEFNRIPILTVLAKQSAIRLVDGFSEYLPVQNAEDYHLWIKMLLEGCKLLGMNGALAAYRRHNSSVSDSDGLNLPSVVEAKLNLAELYPSKAQLILSTVKQTIINSLAQVSFYQEDVFYKKIYRYLDISNRSQWRAIFVMFRAMKMRELALKSVYFIFNYL